MVKRAKELNMPALALTDHGALYGAIEFYKTCKEAGIKPIIGVEAYVASGSRFEKRPGIDNRRFHLTLLAKNLEGYKNLIKLVSLANVEGYYYKPRIDKELMRQYSKGIICLSGCFGSELSRAIRSKNTEKAEEIIREHQDIYGKENYFIEIMTHPEIEGLMEARAELIRLAKKFNIPIVGTQDSHYLHKDDARAHETLLAVQQATDVDDAKRLSFAGDDYYFISTEEAIEKFKDIPEAVENTEKIAAMCDINLELGRWVFPDLGIDKNPDDALRDLVYEGVEKRGLSATPEMRTRIDYELTVIKDKGFSGYFLVVSDLLRFARESGIVTTTRGSVGGSIVSYLSFITTVNPLEYKLPFERFLNPERPSAPDIDMDIADNRRDEMIEYAKKKYGAERVAQIGTFGTMMAKGAVRDVARALGYPYAVGDKISKLIPMGSQGFPMTIARAYEMVPELKEMHEKDSEAKEVLDLAQKLEGCARHISVHAAGVVIAPDNLMEYTPLQFDTKNENNLITQYDMYAIEDAGLLKFDFLGIRNLSILADSVRLVKEIHKVQIDIESIPLDDGKTFQMLAAGETIGLFQLNGTGMTRFLKELRPTTIHDINAMVALYRPGPMEVIPEYIRRKNDPSLVSYLDPRMKKYLEQSHGLIVYQDDLLLSAIELAGYSWLEADKFRKAVGKKIPEEMAAQKIKFAEGIVKNGQTKAFAEKLWKLFEPFQAYGFNKAHAASYGKVAYQTAYMKANYPTEYMTAILTAEAGDVEKIAEIITECKRMGLPVLPPDINESFSDFTVIKGTEGKGDQIRFGLYTIKNFGRDIADAIIAERNARGKFVSFSDFLERIQHKNLNKKSLEALIKTGAMDLFGERGAMLTSMDEALLYHKSYAKEGGMQNSLFGLMANQASIPRFRLKESKEASQEEKLGWEKELLGLYISGHPLEKHRAELDKLGVTIGKIKRFEEGITTIIGGILQEVRAITTAKGERMAFMKIADFTDSIEMVVFPRVFSQYAAILEPDRRLILKGRISHRNGEPSVIVEKVKELR